MKWCRGFYIDDPEIDSLRQGRIQEDTGKGNKKGYVIRERQETIC